MVSTLSLANWWRVSYVAAMILCGLSLNAAILFTLAFRKSLRTVINYYLASLCLVDLALATCTLAQVWIENQSILAFVFFASNQQQTTTSNRTLESPVRKYRDLGSRDRSGDDQNILCKILLYLGASLVFSSNLAMVPLSVERYIAIAYPFLSFRTSCKKRALRIIALFTVLPFIVALPYALNSGIEDLAQPYLLSFQTSLGHRCRECHLTMPHKIYYDFAIYIFIFAVPLFIKTFTGFGIIRVLNRRRRLLSSEQKFCFVNPKLLRRKQGSLESEQDVSRHTSLELDISTGALTQHSTVASNLNLHSNSNVRCRFRNKPAHPFHNVNGISKDKGYNNQALPKRRPQPFSFENRKKRLLMMRYSSSSSSSSRYSTSSTSFSGCSSRLGKKWGLAVARGLRTPSTDSNIPIGLCNTYLDETHFTRNILNLVALQGVKQMLEEDKVLVIPATTTIKTADAKPTKKSSLFGTHSLKFLRENNVPKPCNQSLKESRNKVDIIITSYSDEGSDFENYIDLTQVSKGLSRPSLPNGKLEGLESGLDLNPQDGNKLKVPSMKFHDPMWPSLYSNFDCKPLGNPNVEPETPLNLKDKGLYRRKGSNGTGAKGGVEKSPSTVPLLRQVTIKDNSSDEDDDDSNIVIANKASKDTTDKWNGQVNSIGNLQVSSFRVTTKRQNLLNLKLNSGLNGTLQNYGNHIHFGESGTIQGGRSRRSDLNKKRGNSLPIVNQTTKASTLTLEDPDSASMYNFNQINAPKSDLHAGHKRKRMGKSNSYNTHRTILAIIMVHTLTSLPYCVANILLLYRAIASHHTPQSSSQVASSVDARRSLGIDTTSTEASSWPSVQKQLPLLSSNAVTSSVIFSIIDSLIRLNAIVDPIVIIATRRSIRRSLRTFYLTCSLFLTVANLCRGSVKYLTAWLTGAWPSSHIKRAKRLSSLRLWKNKPQMSADSCVGSGSSRNGDAPTRTLELDAPNETKL